MSAMLQRLIGEHIDVEWKCESGLPHVMGDVPGIEQVLMNLIAPGARCHAGRRPPAHRHRPQ